MSEMPTDLAAWVARRLVPRVSPALEVRLRCEGACACRDCAPDRFPVPADRGERFFDASDGDTRGRYPNLAVAIDGEDCERVTIRSFAGAPGWIDAFGLHDGSLHMCLNCGWSFCLIRLTGAVTVTL